MNTKEFKEMFSQLARVAGFEPAFGGWFKVSPECVVVLDLQKSNFGNYFELNIKIFVQGLFGKNYVRNKELVKRLPGDVFLRPPTKQNPALNLDGELEYERRKKMLSELFETFILPTTNNVLTRSGIRMLKEKGLVHLLPAVETALAAP